MTNRKSPVGRESLLGLICISFETDAIAGISGGTEIKYVDTKTGVDVSGYGNILGAMPLSWNSSTATGLILTTRSRLIIFYPTDSEGKVNEYGVYQIRVFYF